MTDNEGELMSQIPMYAETVASQERDPMAEFEADYYSLDRVYERLGFQPGSHGKRRDGIDPVEPEDVQQTVTLPPAEGGIAYTPMDEDLVVDKPRGHRGSATRKSWTYRGKRDR